MKKILLLCLLIPFVLQGQTYFIKKNVAKVNEDLINFYKSNINLIEKVNGDSVLFVPFEKTFLPDVKIRNINGFLVAYEKTSIGLEKKITIHPAYNVKGIEFKFHTVEKGTYSKVIIRDNDLDSFLRPKDLKKRLEKIENISAEPIPKVKP